MNDEHKHVYSWHAGSLGQGVDAPTSPIKRVAITSVAVIPRLIDTTRLSVLVCNPHPESWNSLMFPFKSFATNADIKPKNANWHEDVTHMIEALASSVLSPRISELDSQLATSIGATTAPAHIDTRYEVKYSETAHLWTAYRYRYVLFHQSEPIALPGSIWLEVQVIGENTQLRPIPGQKLASNVEEFMASATRVAELQRMMAE